MTTPTVWQWCICTSGPGCFASIRCATAGPLPCNALPSFVPLRDIIHPQIHPFPTAVACLQQSTWINNTQFCLSQSRQTYIVWPLPNKLRFALPWSGQKPEGTSLQSPGNGPDAAIADEVADFIPRHSPLNWDTSSILPIPRSASAEVRYVTNAGCKSPLLNGNASTQP